MLSKECRVSLSPQPITYDIRRAITAHPWFCASTEMHAWLFLDHVHTASKTVLCINGPSHSPVEPLGQWWQHAGGKWQAILSLNPSAMSSAPCDMDGSDVWTLHITVILALKLETFCDLVAGKEQQQTLVQWIKTQLENNYIAAYHCCKIKYHVSVFTVNT